VWASTGFGPATTALPDVPARLEPLLTECLSYYERLARYRIKVAEGVPCSNDSTSATAT
jgi:hypothetical protein